MGFQFDFTEIQSKLEQLDKKVSKQITDAALLKGAAITLAGQELTVPRRTGLLAENLAIGKISGTGAKRKVLVGVDPIKAQQLKYAFFLEYGTRHMVGRHWMRTAWTSTVKEASAEIAKSLVQELK